MFQPYKTAIMPSYVSLTETASLLGVSKETLRNWDKSGRLKSVRHPNNNYRMYVLSDVQKLAAEQPQAAYRVTQSLFEQHEIQKPTHVEKENDGQEKDFKRTLARIHRVLRDTDGNSSIVERFDETTKLIFLKLFTQKTGRDRKAFAQEPGEVSIAYARRLRDTFEKLATANESLFPTRFRKLRLSDAALTAVGSILANLELNTSSQDLKGYAYEEMIRNTFDKGDHQQFFTPHAIVEFMISVLGDKLGGHICDPASGTGGFLVEIVRQGRKYRKLVGMEIDERLAWVTAINLYIHGATAAEAYHLENGGSLGQQGIEYQGKFEAIITNPPFGSDFSDRAELDTYTLGKARLSRRRGILFIERCLDLLKENGWLGIVIDEGVLSLPSAADVRELIMHRCEIAAVFSLPETAFMPYASVNTSILILRKTRNPNQKRATFYARAENVGRKPNGDADIVYDDSGAPHQNSDLPEILEAWRHFEQTGTLRKQTDNIFAATPLSLAKDLSSTENRLDFRFHHPARRAAEAAIAHCEYPLAQLGEICDIRNEGYVPSVDFPDQVILYTGLAHLDPRTGIAHQIPTPANALTSGVKKYFRGDVIFARMRPNLRKAAYIEFEKPGYASAECVVFNVKKAETGRFIVDPFLLSILLRSDYTYGQLIHLIAGIGRPRIALRDLLTIRIPIPPHEHQARLCETFLKTKKNYESLRLQARKHIESATALEQHAIEDVGEGFVRRK